jgi:hypothetical protein
VVGFNGFLKYFLFKNKLKYIFFKKILLILVHQNNLKTLKNFNLKKF